MLVEDGIWRCLLFEDGIWIYFLVKDGTCILILFLIHKKVFLKGLLLSLLICIFIKASGELKKNESEDTEHLAKKHGGSLQSRRRIKVCPSTDWKTSLHLKKWVVEENSASFRIMNRVLRSLHVRQLDEHCVQRPRDDHEDRHDEKLCVVPHPLFNQLQKLMTP